MHSIPYYEYSPMQATFYFKLPFYVSFDIFISTSRTTLIFLPTHSLMFEECFRYLQSVLKIIFHPSGVVWNENLQKKGKNSDLSRRFKMWVFFHFFRKFSFQMTPELWKIIFNKLWRYLKHSSNIKECVGKKFRVIRLVEMKISKET